jgi:uncharacterized membrane protein YeaQ/YmgE (transglycosylase-associated protein family)
VTIVTLICDRPATVLAFRPGRAHDVGGTLGRRGEKPQPEEAGMDITSLAISLISGAVGGNAAGAVMKNKSLGTLGNSLAGILGGGVGGAILQALGAQGQSAGSLDLESIVGNVASGGVGGAVVLVLVAVVKGLAKK